MIEITHIRKSKNNIIAWWSGGITSAVTCKLCIDLYGLDRCEFVFIDTFNEDDDTYRFKKDCEKWYGKEIKTITNIGDKYNKIQDVWYKYNSLNTAKGAVCSSELKRKVRQDYQKQTEYQHQAFGFDIKEPNRARALMLNHPDSKPIFPLLLFAYDKKDCVNILLDNGIEMPNAYKYGFLNNNCLGKKDNEGGCVQGGIGYWQKIQREFPKKFDARAKIEHNLTDIKGSPVTMLKDQSKGGGLVFLKPHKDYPEIKDISMMKGREPEPLMECNGFCGTDDLSENKTKNEINYSQLELEI